ncbi:MAG: hypothetical protein MUC79_13830 [Thiobacillaceae bacterium]|jgi:hypothetical protein|nr:hypothetical protein [Thiobacillaceae bacterium]
MRLPLLLGLLLAAALASAADTRHSLDPDSGLHTWEAGADGIAVRLTQIGPDQARAFFLARGFPNADAEHYAAACVFMTVVRNTGDAPLAYNLADWRHRAGDGERRPLKLKEEWLAEWERRGLAQAARIAFAWSQFPSAQTFEPGDWNQGMTTYRLPRGTRFDLDFVWHAKGAEHAATLEGARCAE